MTSRLAFGFMEPAAFLDFLSGAAASASAALPAAGEAAASPGLDLPSLSLFLAAFLGGLALNLTPCVLPMVPVNAILIGRGWRRGFAYALGITLAYGSLGVAAAFFGMPFGSLLGSVWFNAAVAAVFATLALGMAGFLRIDFTRFRRRRANAPAAGGGLAVALRLAALGAMSALLAGACVAPVILATLTETAARVARGAHSYALLPFALGLGLAAPWPLVAAGFSFLPKPGAWMRWINRIFACVLAVFALRYGRAAVALAAGNRDGARDATETENASAVRRLYVIGAPWCGYCKEMERTTLRDPAVLRALAGFDVRRVEIDDFDDLDAYADLKPLVPRIRGVPAYVVVEPEK